MSSKCAQCGKEIGFFDREFKCRGCGRVFCADCICDIDMKYNYAEYGKKVPDYEISFTKFSRVACKACAGELSVINDRIISARRFTNEVTLYSKHYLGRVPKASGCSERHIETDWYRDRDEAENSLKAIARYNECNLVYNVSYAKETRTENSDNGKGTHSYTVFKGSGIATKHR